MLESLDQDDKEELHIQADAILLAFLAQAGYSELVRAYMKIKQERGFWYA